MRACAAARRRRASVGREPATPPAARRPRPGPPARADHVSILRYKWNALPPLRPVSRSRILGATEILPRPPRAPRLSPAAAACAARCEPCVHAIGSRAARRAAAMAAN
ncbi:unnamed protein product [Plutella xylostella]|uniref:(diamondback moth) hypothetical protein n=1 Tax=Plutella xylostella TaxID=51655 RepID=A0A8S4DXM1_PLUXY|nr:unnamed protein product [Plutella xylostella]